MDAEAVRVEAEADSTNFSFKKYCLARGLQAKSLREWVRQHNAGMFSRHFFDNDELYLSYMNGKKTYRKKCYLDTINEQLKRTFPIVSELFAVDFVDGPTGPYQLIARKDIVDCGSVVGEYIGEIVSVAQGEVWRGGSAYICDFAMKDNVSEGNRTFINADNFFSCYFRYANHPPLGEMAHLYLSERSGNRIVVCVKEPIIAKKPVYLNYGDVYFLTETLHKYDKRRSLYEKMCFEASSTHMVVEEVQE